MTKTNGCYSKKLQMLRLNVFLAPFKSGDMGAYLIWELRYIFSTEGIADLHFSFPMRVLIFGEGV